MFDDFSHGNVHLLDFSLFGHLSETAPRVQFMRFDLLCMMAGLLGLLILLFCHLCLEETLANKPADAEAMAALPGVFERGVTFRGR